jgi:hypothetical protein
MLRYAFTNSRNVSDVFHTDELTDRTARGSSVIGDNSLNGTFTSTLTETLLNKLSFELEQRRAVERTNQTSGPGILISGVLLFGTPYSGNDRRIETHLEFADSITLQRRQHLFRFGGRADRVALRTRTPDGWRSGLSSIAGGEAGHGNDRVDDWVYVFSSSLNSNRRHHKGLVTDVSGPQRNACPGTLTP